MSEARGISRPTLDISDRLGSKEDRGENRIGSVIAIHVESAVAPRELDERGRLLARSAKLPSWSLLQDD